MNNKINYFNMGTFALEKTLIQIAAKFLLLHGLMFSCREA